LGLQLNVNPGMLDLPSGHPLSYRPQALNAGASDFAVASSIVQPPPNEAFLINCQHIMLTMLQIRKSLEIVIKSI